MTDKKQPEALRLANVCSNLTRYSMDAHLIAAELRRQHAENTTLQAGYAAARLEIESLRHDLENARHNLRVSQASFRRAVDERDALIEQHGSSGGYPALPVAPHKIGDINLWPESLMRAFADATCAIRASHGQAPAGAGMGHTDGGRNMFYEGRFDGESKREQQARLRWANDMRAAFERHTGNGWFDKDWRTETGLWSSAWHACLAAQPTTTAQAAPAYKDSTPELHIDDSAFESWYSTYSPARKSDKQRARDAYAAGMGDPLVTAAPAAVAGEVLPDEQVAFERHYRHLDLSRERDAWGNLRYTHDAVSLAWESWQARASHGQAPAQAAPVDAIASILNEVMEIAVSNGANSVSMPDHYVEVAAWLAAAPTTQPAPKQEAQEPVEIPAKCPYFGPSPHRDVWLEGWYAACATKPAPQQEAGKAVHQFRKQYCADWYDGRADHGDGGGPYEERTLYTVPQPAAQGDALDAERYRWLTADHHRQEDRARVYEIATSMNVRGKGHIDDAIDVARAAQEGK